MARGDHHNFDAANFSGYTQFLFELINRFRDEAIDAHIDQGGALDDFSAHIPGVVSGETLINHWEPPVVMSVVSSYNGDPRTTLKDEAELDIEVAVFYWDYDRLEAYGIDNAVRLLALIVDQVENKRTLTDVNDQDPLANDVTFSGFETDHRFSRDNNATFNWASTTFTIETLRTKPT